MAGNGVAGAAFGVVVTPEWAVTAFIVAFVVVTPLMMSDAGVKYRPLASLLAWGGVFAAFIASLVVPNWFGWGEWRNALAGPAAMLAVPAVAGVVDAQGVVARWWRCVRGCATAGDAVAVLARRLTDREVREQVEDAMSRAPEDPLLFSFHPDWPGRESMVTPRTVVRWLRSGQPPIRLWQMLCVGMSEDRIAAVLDGAEQLDWAAVETLAALRVGVIPG